ncbi:MAG: hypothetical protein WHT46_07695 [Candidatus Geothermincolales bacterium]
MPIGTNGEGRRGSLLVRNRVPDSVVRVELITFFHRFVGASYDAHEIAERIKRDPEQVRGQLERLVGLNILERSESDGRVSYRYRPPYCAAWHKRPG